MPASPTSSRNRLLALKQSIIHFIKKNELELAEIKLAEAFVSYPRDAELHYFNGVLDSSRLRYADAVRAFRHALRLNSRHAPSHFEIGVIHLTLCRFRKARRAFLKARRFGYNAKQTQWYLKEVDRVAKARDATLSVCLIVKNEEALLPKCLGSVEAVADEIVVVDTGSTDATAQIAEEFQARVFHYDWCDDFAAARNFAKEKATGDWILQVDADEELLPEDQHKVRELIHQNEYDGAFLALYCENSGPFGDNQPTLHYLVRLFKNREDFRYVRPVHEVLQYAGEVVPVDIKLLHHGYNLTEERLQEKRRRNAEILNRRLQDDPEDVVTLFYLSMLHLANKEFELCEQFAKRVLGKSNATAPTQQHIHLMTLNNLALVKNQVGRYVAARRYARAALALNENYLDPYYFLGLAYYHEKKYAPARKAFETFLAKVAEQTHRPRFNLLITSAPAYVFQVCHLLGKMYRRGKRYSEAEQMFARALDLQPEFWPGYADLGYLYMDQKRWRQAADSLDRAINLAKSNPLVNRSNEQVWFDFTNLLKNYAVVLKNMLQEQRPVSDRAAAAEG